MAPGYPGPIGICAQGVSALASLMLPSGTAGDRYGHKRIVTTGLTVFGVSSPACGLAPNAASLVAARAVQGVGAAPLLPLPGTLTIISRAYPERTAQATARFLPGLHASALGAAALYVMCAALVLLEPRRERACPPDARDNEGAEAFRHASTR